MKNKKLRINVVVLVLLAFSPLVQSAVSLQMLKQNNPDLDWAAIENGEVVTHDLPDNEVNKAALAVIVAAKYKGPMDPLLAKLRRANPGAKNIAIDVSSQDSIAQSFQALQISSDNNANIDWFKDPVADGTFNVSRSELQILQQAASRIEGSVTNSTLEPVNQAVRQILMQRLGEYRSDGLSGISPYDIDGHDIYPGDYLADSLIPLEMLQTEAPDFYNAFLQFPAADKGNYLQEFYLVTEMDGDRPVTSLKHWMVDQQAELTLIAERKFYISHSLDAMHTLILALQQGDDTYLFMVNLSFTQKVAGFGSFIAHKVGRSQVKDTIVPIFTSLQQ